MAVVWICVAAFYHLYNFVSPSLQGPQTEISVKATSVAASLFSPPSLTLLSPSQLRCQSLCHSPTPSHSTAVCVWPLLFIYLKLQFIFIQKVHLPNEATSLTSLSLSIFPSLHPLDVLLGSTEYSTSLDMWGVGCIFVEMVTGMPTFPGIRDTYDQLDKIFKLLGTPTEDTWQGVTHFPGYKPHKLGE